MDVLKFSEYERFAEMSRQSHEWHRASDAERAAFDALDQQFRGAVRSLVTRREHLEREGLLTPEGILRELRPQIQPAIRSYAAAVADYRAKFATARRRIETGELVRTADGTFQEVRRAEPTTEALFRAMEIRSVARSLTASEVSQLALRAFAANDAETLDALERAPVALPVLSSVTRETIARARMERAEWVEQDRQAGQFAALHEHLVEKMEAVIGPSNPAPLPVADGRITLTASQAKDPEMYRVAKAQAEQAGAELVTAG